MALLTVIPRSSLWNEQALCSPRVLNCWSQILLAGLTRWTLCSRSCCLSWEFWVGKADCCGNKEKRLAESFSLRCHTGLSALLSPTAERAWPMHPFWSCSPICVHADGGGCMLKDDNSCVQAALQKANVCVAVDWPVSAPSKKKKRGLELFNKAGDKCCPHAKRLNYILHEPN